MSPASTFTDHSMAAILRQPLPAWNLSPSVGARREQDDACMTKKIFEPLCTPRTRRATLLFTGHDDDVTNKSAHHQTNAGSFSMSVDLMTLFCSSRSGKHFDQRRQEKRKNSDETVLTMQSAGLLNTELVAAGFGTSSASAEAGVQGDDCNGKWTSHRGRGGVLRPTPTFPHRHRSPSCTVMDSPRLELESADLWTRFDRLTTEMVITKSGRRMFPALKFKVTGLDIDAMYVFVLDIIPVDSFRYKFQDSRWVIAGNMENNDLLYHHHRCVYTHPDSPADGRHWMSKTLSFHRLKLTNNVIDNCTGHALLSSMHFYQPRVHLLRHISSIDGLSSALTFTFPQTRFIAVTAYQNNKITQLKIDHNPFAKGFRVCNSTAKMDKRKRLKLHNDCEAVSSDLRSEVTKAIDCDFADVGISNDSADHIRVSSDQPSLRSSRTDYQQSCEYCAIQPLPTSLFDRVNHQIGSQTDQTDWCQTGHQHPGWSPVLMSTDVDLPQCTLLHRPKPLRFRPYQ